MTLRLLIDENSQARILVNKLSSTGYIVLTVAEVGLNGCSDVEVLAKASELGCILLTHDCKDFLALHRQNPDHAGIVAIYQDAKKRMSYDQILAALANLEQTDLVLAGQFTVLNHYLW